MYLRGLGGWETGMQGKSLLLLRGSLQREAKAKLALREQVEMTGLCSLSPRANRRLLGDCRKEKEKATGELLGNLFKKYRFRGLLPWWSSGKDSALPMQGAWV